MSEKSGGRSGSDNSAGRQLFRSDRAGWGGGQKSVARPGSASPLVPEQALRHAPPLPQPHRCSYPSLTTIPADKRRNKRLRRNRKNVTTITAIGCEPT